MGYARLAALMIVTAACTATGVGQVSIMGSGPPTEHRVFAHVHNDSTIELPVDESVVEPSQPYTGTPEERLLTHIHTPTGVCSGIVVAPRLVVTAHQCVPQARGVSAADGAYRIEIPTGALTWTERKPTTIVAPACAWDGLDVSVLVLGAPADWVKPLPLGTVPGPGAKVQALGFGRCVGQNEGIRDKAASILSVDSQAFVVDTGLCRGDVGGFVADGSGNFLGIVSHQDDPDDSPRHTTTIYRADTTPVRALFAQAEALVNGADSSKWKPVACP